MTWKCPNCGFELDDSLISCHACGYTKACRLVLTSNEGVTWRTVIEAEVTRRTYRRLYPGTEHQYVPRAEGCHPFEVSKKENNVWVLRGNASSPVGVALNDLLCNDNAEYYLNEGDIISITSRANPTARVAPLKVSFVPLDNSDAS